MQKLKVKEKQTKTWIHLTILALSVFLLTFAADKAYAAEVPKGKDTYMGCTIEDSCKTDDRDSCTKSTYKSAARIRPNSYNTYSGIDVSKWQKNIDWNAVKASGVQFVVVKVAGRDTSTGELYEDPYFRENLSGASAAGLKVGVYFFSQAVNETEAAEEANYISRLIAPYKIQLPVFCDYEWDSSRSYRVKDGADYNTRTAAIDAFCRTIISNGYTAGFYGNDKLLKEGYNGASLANSYVTWCARYSSNPPGRYYEGVYDFWQYSSKGAVPGISGNVDMDYWYMETGREDYGFTGMCMDGDKWVYYSNGLLQEHYTGMAHNAYGWWYFKDGSLYTGMEYTQNGWVYYRGGQVDKNFTGMACNEYGWWYYQNGQLDWNYTGMACNEYGWWYYQNGRLVWDYTGMACNEYGWWYYRNGQLDWNYTGMACNEYGWWYYQNGQLDWNYTGMACNEYGWWYYQNGQLDWNYTGMACNEYGWWYYQNGRLVWDYTGMACNEYGWWYYQNGRLNWTYTGMACNEYGWWYYKDGRLAWDYTGFGTNEYGDWYYQNGRLDQSFSGEVTVDGVTYTIENGKLIS